MHSIKDSSQKIGSKIVLEDVCVGYSAANVLSNISLTVEPGEFVALLGASGCGKTTLLRSLAGFVPIRSGRLILDGRDIAGTPPEKREMSMMFQSYALWPHLDVTANIGYGLRIRGIDKPTIARKVRELVQLVGLEGLERRKIAALSGGQKQRVALARALCIDPPVLLLDEPLSNLDAGIRATMRHEICALQKKLGLTAILVTHDREEAMSMADRVVILNEGRIAQVGSPEEVFNKPNSSYVAQFMGATNALPVILVDHDGQQAPQLATNGQPAQKALYFRSEAARICEISDDNLEQSAFVANGEIAQQSYLGSVYRHTIAFNGHAVMVDHPTRLQVGSQARLYVPAAGYALFPAEADPRPGQ
nr:ABC transporter ATP-binding protein [uncultured Cohaesibacter sp.]